MCRFLTIVLLVAGFLVIPQAGSAQDNKVGGKRLPEWIEILKDQKDVKERTRAVIALQVYGAKTAGVTDALLEALDKDLEPQIRSQIALLLGKMGPDAIGAADALGKALSTDKSDEVREAAALALGGKLAEKAEAQVVHLAAALKSKHAGTRVAAAETLRNMGEKAKPALAQLIEVAEDKTGDSLPRQFALQVISRHGDETAAIKVLQGVFEEGKNPLAVRVAAVEGLGFLGEKAGGTATALSKGLKEKESELRRAVATALGKFGEKAKECWPAIKEALQDPDVAVRYQAIRVTGNLGMHVAETVKSLGEVAQKDTNQENRLAAIQELGELGAIAIDALPTLETLATSDPRAAIRDAAAAAKKKIKS